MNYLASILSISLVASSGCAILSKDPVGDYIGKKIETLPASWKENGSELVGEEILAAFRVKSAERFFVSAKKLDGWTVVDLVKLKVTSRETLFACENVPVAPGTKNFIWVHPDDARIAEAWGMDRSSGRLTPLAVKGLWCEGFSTADLICNECSKE